jgi:hypothetical protein
MTKDGQGWQYGRGGSKISLYIEVEVEMELDLRAKALERSVSWVANKALRKGLGMMVDEGRDNNT